jgi:uncharacterized protein
MQVFDWDDDNVDHIERHGVEPWETEEAAEDRHRIPFPAHSGRLGLIGRTEDGRFLVVILERLSRGWRVVTARDATSAEKRIYRRRSR